MQITSTNKSILSSTSSRMRLLEIFVVLMGVIISGRLFYIQIIKHDYYQEKAISEHVKKFGIIPDRGIIRISDGDSSVPIVLNESRYTIYADPAYIVDSEETANKLVEYIGGNRVDIEDKLNSENTRYVILAKKVTKDVAERIMDLNLKGIAAQDVNARTYPQGQLAAQVLGFVNDDGQGQYGIEGSLNDKLTGRVGLQKAITDVRGVPLAVNNENIIKRPQPGEDITLTLDITMQKIVEDALKEGIERTSSEQGCAIIMDANSGAIKAMTSYPSYDPSNYSKVKDISVFSNLSVTGAWEPGSVMKPLITSAALTEGTVNANTSYYDPGYVLVGDRRIINAFEYGAQTMTVRDVIVKSLNTGAVFILKTLGGGEINDKARSTWYKYLTTKYLFGHNTGIEQMGEEAGVITGPNEGDGIVVRYSNMAFGQGMLVTPIQLVAAYASIVNGGNYYQPSLIAKTNINGSVGYEAKLIAKDVIAPDASKVIRQLLKEALAENNAPAIRNGYDLGGKSGTAQVADGRGGYKKDRYNGTYVGYLSGADKTYILLVRLDEPKTSGFASFQAAKVWAQISNTMINNLAIRPN